MWPTGTPACAELAGMEFPRFLDCLATDFARLRAVVPTNFTAAVPSCPGWTVADLTRHVGEVYLHKTLAIREGAEPEPWPPKEIAEQDPLALLDRAYAGLLAGSPGRTYTVGTYGAAWRVRTGSGLFTVEDGAGDDAADVTVSGPPTAVLRWVWNRESAGESSGVTVEGAPEAVAELRQCIVIATQ
jgi:hypothetical protein